MDEPEPRGLKSPGVGKGTVGSWHGRMQPQPFGGLHLSVQLTHLNLCEAFRYVSGSPSRKKFPQVPRVTGAVSILEIRQC